MKYISGILKFSNASQDKSDKTALFLIEVDSNSLTKIVEIKSDLYTIEFEDYLSPDKIEFKANKLNKLTLYVEQCRLKFSYHLHPELPIMLNATIKSISGEKIEYNQPTNEIRNYPSGKYSIEINSVPISKHNIEMKYQSIFEIQLPLEGNLILKIYKGVTNIQVSTQASYPNNIIDYIDWEDESIYPLSLLPFPYKISWTKDGINKKANFRVNSGKRTKFICD